MFHINAMIGPRSPTKVAFVQYKMAQARTALITSIKKLYMAYNI